MTRQIAQLAIDHIVKEEVTGKEYYEKHYQDPEWPGGSSGVTVGIGYDLGYQTREKIARDWTGKVDGNSLPAMLRCAGIKGSAAKQFLPQVKASIRVPWNAAMDVFMNRDIPEWTATLYKHLGPNLDLLSPLCVGILVGLIYNRGAGGFVSRPDQDRYREMRAIKQLVATKQFTSIPAQLDSMARLWVGTDVAGVATRRHTEARLFRQGLTQPAIVQQVPALPPVKAPDPNIARDTPSTVKARTPQPATTNAQNGTAGGIVAAGGAAAAGAAQAGYHWGVVIAILVVSVVIGGIIWGAWYANRNPAPMKLPA